MKKHIHPTGIWIAVALMALMVACNPPKEKTMEPMAKPSVELAAIDSLMWRQPDSAFAQLLQFAASPKADSLDVFNGHYCQLLISELLYKKDYGQSNREDLLKAVDYFDSLIGGTGGADTRGVFSLHGQNVFLDARAHYINGVGYYEQENTVQACAEYLKALEVMEKYFDEKELVGKKAQFMALTYTRLTSLFSDLYFHEQAIYFGKKSMVYYNKYNAFTRHVSWILNEIGSHYNMINNYDSAAFYYRRSLMVLPDTNNLAYRDVATHLAFLSYNMGGLPGASLNQLQRLIRQSETPKETLSRYAIIGEIYYHENQFDSAWIYLNKVFHESQNANSRKQAAERLATICKIQGKEGEIIKYAGFLVPYATQDEDKGIIKSQLAELYNIHKQQELIHQHRLKVKKQTRWSVGVVIGLLMVMLGIFVLYWKYKRKKQSLEVQIKKEQYAHEIKQKALSGRLKQSNEALRIQKKETNDLAKEMGIHLRRVGWNHLDDFMKESICHDILIALRGKQIKREAKSDAYPELHLSNAQLHDLSVAVEKHFCRFEKTLTDLYPKINRNAINQCLLYLLNLEDVQIAALLSCDYSTVKRRTTKLKETFNTEKEPRQFIRELVL